MRETFPASIGFTRLIFSGFNPCSLSCLHLCILEYTNVWLY